MKLFTCCPHAGCGGFHRVLRLQRSHGVEPRIGLNPDGHYFAFQRPRWWGRTRWHTLEVVECHNGRARPARPLAPHQARQKPGNATSGG